VGDYNYFNNNPYRLENIDLNNQGDLYYQQHNLQQVKYNAFKKPIEINEEGKGRVDFEYGPLMNRTQAYYGGTAVNKLNRTFRKSYSSIFPVEIIENNAEGNSKIITYIGGDAYSAPIAHIKVDNDGLGNNINEYHYLHRDYLSSILAITDSSGIVQEQTQFGAWGVVDKFINFNSETAFSHNSLLGRGYTGHEHFFEVSLIHMNGRMYDANLGRFLSPDNFIQDPYNTQSFNRYSYVWNNPLSLNDPTGEIVWVAVFAGAIIGAVAGAAAYVAQAIIAGNWDWGKFGVSILGGAIIGGLTGGLSPMSLGANSLWTVAAVGFVGAFLPAYEIPLGDWSFSFSPAIAFGNASGAGINFRGKL
jgi:RHS repeat-associated protein